VITLDLLQLALACASSDLRVSLPGRVTRVDAARGRVSVLPQLSVPRPGPEDGEVEYEEIPELLDVPVWTYGTAAVEVALALAPGDPGLLVFADFPIGEWLRSGGVSRAPADPHGTSGAVFLPGLHPSGEGPALPATGARVGMRGSGPHLELSASGVIARSAGTAVALATLADVNAVLTRLNLLVAAFNAHQSAHPAVGAGTPTVIAPATVAGTTVLKGQ
jgi:hypothetical protein